MFGGRNSSKMLEEESGHRAEPDDATPLLLSCVSAGRWQQALTLLSSVQVTLPLSVREGDGSLFWCTL